MKSVLIRVNPWLKNEKGCSFKGKSTIIAAVFMQNKPNLKNIKIGVSPFETSKYEILPAWRGEKTNPIQTQFKANSKPIQSQFKPNRRKAKNERKYL